jgi:N-methylhydantoinase A
MIAAAKMHVAERGRDPRRYALVAFGGMGPMHAHAVAAGLKIGTVICPASAGVLSAWGMLVAPMGFELARSLVGRLDAALLGRAESVFAAMEAEGARLLLDAGVPRDAIRFQRSADMRYEGQTRELTVPLPAAAADLAAIRAVFTGQYRGMFGHAHDDLPLQLITCRVVASAPAREVPNRPPRPAGGDARRGERPVFFEAAGGHAATPVHDRYRLAAGATLDGPAVIEEHESTAVVPPGATARVDEELNLVVTL